MIKKILLITLLCPLLAYSSDSTCDEPPKHTNLVTKWRILDKFIGKKPFRVSNETSDTVYVFFNKASKRVKIKSANKYDFPYQRLLSPQDGRAILDNAPTIEVLSERYYLYLKANENYTKAWVIVNYDNSVYAHAPLEKDRQLTFTIHPSGLPELGYEVEEQAVSAASS